MRTLINIGMPGRPTQSIQIEGRAYRTGQVTDVAFRYLTTGADYERFVFASRIAERSGTAENLAMGEDARALKEAFINAYLDADEYPAGESDGKGGKAADRATVRVMSRFDQAKGYYYANQKRNGKTKSKEGTDYFATPEPVGLKMVEWSKGREGEATLEPSGGHGAIARWMDPHSRITTVEPSMHLAGRLKMALPANARLVNDTFESLDTAANKFDTIVMNPPFGTGGKTAIEHLDKALKHLNDGGRIVALIPEGPATEKRFTEWLYGSHDVKIRPLVKHEKLGDIFRGDTVTYKAPYGGASITGEAMSVRDGYVFVKVEGNTYASAIDPKSLLNVEAKGPRSRKVANAPHAYVRAEFGLPPATFERAGTSVKTRIVVIDKIMDEAKASAARQQSRIDLDAENVNALFDRIQDLDVPDRVAVAETAEAAPVTPAKPTKADSKPAPAGTFDRAGRPIVEHTTGKGKVIRGIVVPKADMTREQAKAIDEFTFQKDGGWFIREKHLAPETKYSLDDREPAENAVAKSFIDLAKHDDAFQGGKSSSTDFATVLKDIRNTEALKGLPWGVHTQTRKTLIFGRALKFGNKVDVAQDVVIHNTDSETPYVVITPSSKNINGAIAYQAAFTWAHNNGKRMVPDPNGLTPINYLRRSEAMISSMLRHSSSAHLEPHPLQYVGLLDQDDYDAIHKKTNSVAGMEVNIELPPAIMDKLDALKAQLWTAQDKSLSDTEQRDIFESNLNNLAIAAAELAERRAPELNDFRIGQDGQLYEYQLDDTWRAVESDSFESLISSERSAESGVGATTLRRVALTRSILEGWTRAPGTGIGHRSQRQQRLGGSSDGGLRGMYGRGGESAGAAAHLVPRVVSAAVRENILYSLADRKAGKNAELNHQVDASIAAITRKWVKGPAILLVDSPAQAPFDCHPDAKGAYHNGSVYLFRNNLNDAADAQFVVLHEVVGHFGLSHVLGDRLDGVLRQIYTSNKNVREYADAIMARRARKNLHISQTVATEEALANLAGERNHARLNFWQRFMATVRDGLRSLGFDIHFTDADIVDLLHSSQRYVETGEAPKRRLAALLRSPTVQVPLNALRGLSGKDLVAKAKEIYRNLSRARTMDGRDVQFTMRGFKEAANHSGDVRVMQVVPALPELVRSAVPLWTEPNTKAVAGDSTIAYHNYGARAELDGKPVFVRIVVREDLNGNFHYDHDTTSAEVMDADMAKDQGKHAPGANDGRERVYPYPLSRPNQARDKAFQEQAPERLAKNRLYQWMQSVKAMPAEARYSLIDDARIKAGLQKPKQTYSDRIRAILDNLPAKDLLQQEVFDKFHGINVAERRNMGNLPTEQSAYVAARFSTGLSSIMHGVLLHGAPKWMNGVRLEKVAGSKGLLEIFEPVKDELDDWLGWMVGRRADRLMSEGKENNFTRAESDALKDLAKGREQKFLDVANAFAEFKGKILDVGEGAGIIDASTRPMWDQLDWIPFYRNVEADGTFAQTVSGPKNKKGFSGQNSGIKKLRGGESAINDPLENILMNFAHIIDASLKNNVLRLALEHADDAIEKAPHQFLPQLIPLSEVKRALEQNGVDPLLISAIPKDALQGLQKMWSIQPPAGKDIVRVMKNGKTEYYRVKDPLLLKALTSFASIQFPGLNTMRFLKRLLTSMTTSTPEFIAANYTRDVVAAMMTTRHGFHFADSLKGIKKSYMEQGGFEDMLFAGASFAGGHIEGSDPASSARNMRRTLRSAGFDRFSVRNAMLKAWEKYRELGDAVENANREAIYEATLGETGSRTKAAYEAKDIMDFSLRGSNAVIQVLADVVPFLNSRMQGMYRLGRSEKKRLLIGGAMMMTVSALLLLANHDDDRWKQLPDYEKDMYWHLFFSKDARGHVRIPKPFELGAVFGAIPERILSAMLGDITAKKALQRVAWNIFEQIKVDPTPQALKPALEVAMNYDTFRGKAIENAHDQRIMPHMRSSGSTSDTMKLIADLAPGAIDTLGLGPKKLEHLWTGYFGAMGAYTLGLADMIIHKAQGGPASPEARLDQYPLIKRFYQEDPARASQFKTDLYAMYAEVSEKERSISDAQQQGDYAQAKQIRDENRDKLRQAGKLSATADILRMYQKKIDRITQDAKMSPKEKRIQIDELMDKGNKLAARVAPEVAKAAGF